MSTRILAVDDSEEARDILAATLASGGFEDVTLAESAVAAVRLLGIAPATSETLPVDVILLDVVMPGMDGIEACASIRSDPRYEDVPILMVTAQTDTESLTQAFIAGANDYINKPFDRTEMLARIKSAIKLKKELDRRRSREDQLMRLTSELRRQGGDGRSGQRDPGTGLLTRDGIEQAARAMAGQSGLAPLAALAVQIDLFGPYRHHYGDAHAERLHGQVATAVASLRAPLNSAAGIIEPGLFAILAPRTDDAAAQALAEEARQAVERLAVPHQEAISADVVTVSVGCAVARPGGPEDPQQVLSEALRRTGLAAAAGGNRSSSTGQVTFS